METRLIENYKEPYVKGPHLKYFIGAVSIALFIMTILIGGVVLMMHLLRG